MSTSSSSSVGVSINDVSAIALPAMTSSETALKAKLSSVASGDSVTAIDLLQVQTLLSSNSLTAEVGSSMAKQRKDAEENIIQKF